MRIARLAMLMGRSRKPLTAKRGNKRFMKGSRTGPEGKHGKRGQYRVIEGVGQDYVVPADLATTPLKPVSFALVAGGAGGDGGGRRAAHTLSVSSRSTWPRTPRSSLRRPPRWPRLLRRCGPGLAFRGAPCSQMECSRPLGGATERTSV